MIACDKVAEALARSLSGNASRADDQALQAHVVACPACAELQRRQVRVWALMGSLPAVPAPALKAPALPARRELDRRILTWAAAAAALLVALVYAFSGGSPATVPASTSPAAPVVHSPAPEEEPREVQVEKERVESVLATETEKAAPGLPKLPPSIPPAPAPLAVEPQTAAPTPAPKPEVPTPVVVKTPEPLVPSVAATPAPEREEAPAAAILDSLAGDVVVVHGERRLPAKDGMALPAGGGLLTSGRGSQAVLAFSDGTRVVLGADSAIGEVWPSRGGDGKRVLLQKGILAAQIARQPEGEGMSFLTPLAEALVLGTRLSLSVNAASTRIEVREGRVRFSRRGEAQAVELGPDQYAVAGRSGALQAKALAPAKLALKETFDRGRWGAAWTQSGDSGQGIRLSVEGGSLAVKIAQRASEDVPSGAGSTLPPGTPDAHRKVLDQAGRLAPPTKDKDWPRAAWLESRVPVTWSAAAPLRIRTRLWTSADDPGRSVWLALGRGAAGQGLRLERRGATLQLSVEGADRPLWSESLASAETWETLELWISKDQILLRRNGETLHAAPLPGRLKAGLVSIGVQSKPELSRDQEVRFDEIEAGWVGAAEFEAVAR